MEEKNLINVDPRVKKVLTVVIPLIIACLSFFVAAKWATNVDTYAKTIASLDEKKQNVMELTAASTAASAAITLIPGDVATPIATKLADISGYFVIVICALYLEKYLLTITGFTAFTLLIPVACAVLIAAVLSEKKSLYELSAKIALFGLMIFLLVPASVKVSNMIETTYRESIDATIANAQQTTEEIEEAAGAEGQEASGNENANWWEKFTQGVTDTISVKTEEFRDMLNSMMEAFAVMLVTSCVIPILVLVFFAWLVKTILSVNLGAAGTPAKLE